ncbi:4-hydroxy-tetrahydrodipicolinate synthase [Aeromicrobium sp. 636]|uniref:4-hydroxy-tetrahydrodipicolinate synthase n=1 Tax=Aeromicrobium senzhongii TaxID=2663859 RepID=A0A8I0ERR4_9ACTN|nr:MULTISPECIES: 4-hydroxy-tetrahydrodipicolinate synthase [Aeromicrobium]MBC9224789.1 4-hydroxy-tetrahydrodipicolinate synthase [Aeromicrobium senzhongii]MCQ3996902.1 4-hydroxy-tetrahydrodipicolinate synthase [Aeromicrobium sp. 636]
MTSPLATEAAPFGRLLTAMATPFTPDGELDLDAAAALAQHLVESGSDGIVVSGTTGESPTTTGEEDGRLLAAVLEAVGDRATIVAGVGTNDTRHTVELAEQAVRVGAHGLLLVSPYYSKPPQAGILANIDAVVAAAGDTPIMLYDILGRTAVEISEATYAELESRPTVVAVKDASGDLARGARLRANSSLALYAGDDALALPWLALGAVGVVSVVSHVVASPIKDLIAAVDAGDLVRARQIDNELLPLIAAIMGQTQGAIAAKAALVELGVIPHAGVRLPLTPATDEQVQVIRAALKDADLLA